jgi:hypothetical protein
MHTIWVRLNAVIFFGLTVLLSLSLLAALSKYGHEKRSQPGALLGCIKGMLLVNSIFCALIECLLTNNYGFSPYPLKCL